MGKRIARSLRIAPVVIFGLATLGLSLVSPVASAARKDEVSILVRDVAGYAKDWWVETLGAFKAKYPDIKVKILAGTASNTEKLVAMVAAGASPDVAWIAGSTMDLAAKGVLEPLDKYMDADKVNKSLFFPAFVSMLSYGEKMYAFDPAPAGPEYDTIGINADMFNNAGVPLPNETWRWEEECIRYGQKIARDTNGDGIPEQYFSVWSYPDSMHEVCWVYGAGGTLMRQKDGKAVFAAAEEPALKGLQFGIDLINKYKIGATPGAKALGGDVPFIAFYSKKSKIAMGRFGNERGLMKGYKSDFDFRLAIGPSYNGKRPTRANPRYEFAISRGSKNLKLAWTFIKYLMSDEAQKIVAKYGAPGQPMVKSKAVWDYERSLRHPDDIKVLQYAAEKRITTDLFSIPQHPGWNKDVEPVFAAAVLKAATGKMSIKQAMTGIEPQVNNLLARYRFRK